MLPFTNLSGDPEQEYFADGVADELITALSRVRNIEAKQIERELSVRYVVDGSVRKSRRKVPWQREADLQHLLERLRKAGWRV